MVIPIWERVASLETNNWNVMKEIQQLQIDVKEVWKIITAHVVTENEDRIQDWLFKTELKKIIQDFMDEAHWTYALKWDLIKYDKAAAFYTRLKWSLYVIWGFIWIVWGLFSNVIASYIYDFLTRK